MDATITFHLLRLPMEMKEEIASFLPAKDVGSLRLTCRLINFELWNQFQLRFFQTRRVLLPSPENLQTFADITEHPTLRSSMQNVVLVADPGIFKFAKWQDPVAFHGDVPRLPGIPQRYPTSVSDLYPDGYGPAAHDDRATLARAFLNLPNLKTVQIRNVKGEANSLDWRRTHNMEHERHVEDLVLHLFSLAVAALADADARPECLEVSFGQAFDQGGLPDFAYHIPGPLQSNVAAMLSRLQRLEFSFGGRFRTEENAPCLLNFLSLATQLVSLTMNFYRCYPEDVSRRVIEWLGRTPGLKKPVSPVPGLRITNPVRFAHLQELRLREMSATPVAMLNVLIKLGSQLHTLELYLHSLVDDENEIDDRVDIWAPFFRSIAQHCSLREFEIRTPHTTYPNSGWRQRSDREFAFPLIYFRSQQDRDSGAKACNFKHFSGLDVSADIEALADILYIPWPQEDDWLRDDQDSWGDPLSNGGDGEDDGEDDSEDDGEDDAGDGDEDGNEDGDEDGDGDGNGSSDDSD